MYQTGFVFAAVSEQLVPVILALAVEPHASVAVPPEATEYRRMW